MMRLRSVFDRILSGVNSVGVLGDGLNGTPGSAACLGVKYGIPGTPGLTTWEVDGEDMTVQTPFDTL